MDEKKIHIEIVGQDAEECANLLSEIISTEFGSEPVKFNLKDQHVYEGPGKKFDPTLIGAVAGVISAGLAFPAAIIAGLQIKDRLSKKRGFEQLLEKGKEIKKTKRISMIRFRIGNMEFEFEKTSYAEISDAIS